jgi:hypothetical protein
MINIMEETLGTKFTNVRGYPGGVEIDLALEKGELHCRGTGITTHFAREPYHTWHKTGFDRHILQTGNKKDPRIADAPTLPDLMEKNPGRRSAQTFALRHGGTPLVTAGCPPAGKCCVNYAKRKEPGCSPRLKSSHEINAVSEDVKETCATRSRSRRMSWRG